MIDPPEITRTTAQSAAVIHILVPKTEIQRVMGPAIGEVMAAISAQGIEPAGLDFGKAIWPDPRAARIQLCGRRSSIGFWPSDPYEFPSV